MRIFERILGADFGAENAHFSASFGGCNLPRFFGRIFVRIRRAFFGA